MRRILGLAWLDRRLIRRDPVGLFFTLVLPLAIVAVLGPIHAAAGDGTEVVGVVVEEPGAVSSLLEGRLAANPTVVVRHFADRAAADRAVRRQEVGAAVVVPAAVNAPGPGPSQVVLVGPPGVVVPGGVRAAVEGAVAETAAIVEVGRAIRPDDPLGRGLAAAEDRADAALASRAGRAQDDPESRRNDALARAVIGTTVLFTFMNSMAKSSLLSMYRELGVLARLRTTPTTPGQAAGGFALGIGGFSVVQALLILVGATVLLDVSWSDPIPVVAVTAAIGLTAGCLGALTGSLLPSSASGSTVAGPVGFVLAMLGGCLWPLSIVPPALRRIGHATPHAWAVDALGAAQAGGPAGDWLAPTAVMLAFAAVVAVAAGNRLHRLVRRAV
jgi:ABC-2 type transport system permease protein